jgi:hypothetical protein
VVVAGSGQAGPARDLAARLAAPANARIKTLPGGTTAAAIIECARAEMAGTVLVQ